jgi:hypothetical protein
MLDHPGLHRIDHHVTKHVEELGLLLHEDSMKPSLEEMTDPAVSSVEVDGVSAEEPLHAARERWLERLDHEMKMRGHQRITGDQPLVASSRLSDQTEKVAAVAIVEEDVVLGIATRGEMPDRLGEIDA